MSNRNKAIFGALMLYAGFGFPAADAIGKKLVNIAKFEKRATAENIAVGVGAWLLLTGASGALLS